ncbi:MAG: hypothetical protein ACFFE3_03620, partial [Candidatus Thorarchaeota archaeon]
MTKAKQYYTIVTCRSNGDAACSDYLVIKIRELIRFTIISYVIQILPNWPGKKIASNYARFSVGPFRLLSYT